MKSHTFVLVLSGISEPDESLEDALFDAGCDDAILAFRSGVGYLEFDREAHTLESAILSAVRSVERAKHPVTISHVEPPATAPSPTTAWQSPITSMPPGTNTGR